MSTRATYQVASRSGLGELAAGLRLQRAAEAERLRAELRVFELRARANRLMQEGRAAERQGQAEAAAFAERAARQLAVLTEREQQINSQLATLRNQLVEHHAASQQLGQEIRSAVTKIEQDLANIVREAASLEATVQSATFAVGEAATATREAVVGITALGEASRESADLQREMLEKTARLKQLESALAFLSREQELALPTLLTLMAMEANGYRLRETISKDGLIAYFESADQQHQIAVRCRPLEQPGTQHERWELEAETFAMEGAKPLDEACLGILADFHTELEETGLGEVMLQQRHYPKRDGQTGIPVRRQRRVDMLDHANRRRERE